MINELRVHRIDPSGNIHHNKKVDELAEIAIAKGIARRSKTGAIVVNTGKYTGRSPKDRYIVDTTNIHSTVDWGEINLPISQKQYMSLHDNVSAHLSASPDLFIYDGIACADPKYQIHIRIISELAHQALFANHVLHRPVGNELVDHKPDLTILAAPDCHADSKKEGINSEAFVVLNLEEKIVLIGGTHYSGEIKKSIFSYLNYLLPKENVLPMHCSANIGENNESALFFGLSGTGKTTLSADPTRMLVGDDEHGWSENGIFNFEGGCYAKCINLSQENEPQIWAAIRDHAVVENVVLDDKGTFYFEDDSLAENTRVSYPLEYIDNAIESGTAGHPAAIIFLTADAFGVLPPVAKLNNNGAMYHFLSGYTSKIAGTEREIISPQATFSACFGAPFMPLDPLVYAKLLKKYLARYKSKVFLVNTGWFGGEYGVGKRISIKNTRSIISAILEHKLDNIKTTRDPFFNLTVPTKIDGIDSIILNPRNLWKNKKSYDKKACKLAKLFNANMKKFKNIPDAVLHQGPA